MAIKFDLAKAFDKVEWVVLSTILSKLGFHDKFISLVNSWNPSLSGKFTVKAAYHWIIHGKMNTQSSTNVTLWKQIWNFGLHNRHKLFLWRVSLNLLPTSDKLSRFLHIQNSNCLLCGHHLETLPHMLLTCPTSKLIWWNSPWQLRMDAFQQFSPNQWLHLILLANNLF